ncbi:hypothetical protein, partial [Fusobacterium necrophorum]
DSCIFPPILIFSLKKVIYSIAEVRKENYMDDNSLENQELLNKTIKNFLKKYNKAPLLKTTETDHGIKTEIFVTAYQYPISVGFRYVSNLTMNNDYVICALEAFKNLDLSLLQE